MNDVNIITQMGNPEILAQMSAMDRFMGSLMVTVLGMGITFVSLIVIRYATVALSSVVKSIESKNVPEIEEVKAPKAEKPAPAQAVIAEEDEEELIAVISAAVAATLQTSVNNIVVTNIRRVPDPTPAWGVAGRAQQMGNLPKLNN